MTCGKGTGDWGAEEMRSDIDRLRAQRTKVNRKLSQRSLSRRFRRKRTNPTNLANVEDTDGQLSFVAILWKYYILVVHVGVSVQ